MKSKSIAFIRITEKNEKPFSKEMEESNEADGALVTQFLKTQNKEDRKLDILFYGEKGTGCNTCSEIIDIVNNNIENNFHNEEKIMKETIELLRNKDVIVKIVADGN